MGVIGVNAVILDAYAIWTRQKGIFLLVPSRSRSLDYGPKVVTFVRLRSQAYMM